MKNLVFAMVACVAMTFASCGNKTANNDEADTVAVDTVDTVAVDTILEDSTICND